MSTYQHFFIWCLESVVASTKLSFDLFRYIWYCYHRNRHRRCFTFEKINFRDMEQTGSSLAWSLISFQWNWINFTDFFQLTCFEFCWWSLEHYIAIITKKTVRQGLPLDRSLQSPPKVVLNSFFLLADCKLFSDCRFLYGKCLKFLWTQKFKISKFFDWHSLLLVPFTGITKVSDSVTF